MSASCPACGTENPEGQKFCGERGGRLVAAAASPVPPVPRPAVPERLARKILHGVPATVQAVLAARIAIGATGHARRLEAELAASAR